MSSLVHINSGNQFRKRTVKGGATTPLKPKTIRNKRSKRYPHPTAALLATMKMYNNVRSKVFKKKAIVYISKGGQRDSIGRIHQEVGVNKHTRTKREFFGVASSTFTWVDYRIKRWLKQKMLASIRHASC